MLYASTTAKSVTAVLRGSGFEELFPLNAVPAGNARRVRYGTHVTARRDGSRWAVRSYGTGFDLVDPSRRDLCGRWYSLGWGMVGSRQADELLLVQADGIEDAEADRLVGVLAGAVAGRSSCWTHSVEPGRRGATLRMAAVLGPVPEGRD
ncbi:hypothetical protein [Streptantibioticus silvisoli]|uniref:Uncharacterized protein n=1 Tax=Streptantibioticus silvisoli TaxID=2705255 RepID=A0ABT6VRK7_9ACTN|nr:hypothetical protein [Streptantibioticus silvisoli]MDI5961126.1 hypothetical protein [Streptantibioticus silvisoli]